MRAAQQLVEAHIDKAGAGGFRGPGFDVVGNHLRAKSARFPVEFRSAQRFVGEGFVAVEAHRFTQSPREREQQRKRVLGDDVVAVAGDGRHRNTVARAAFEVDVIGRRRARGDQPQRGVARGTRRRWVRL